MFYSYDAFGSKNLTGDVYFAGLADSIDGVGYRPRYLNVYNQHKWDKVKEISKVLNEWKDYLEWFKLAYTNSYSYNDAEERSNLISNTFFKDVFTYPTGYSANCPESYPGYSTPDAQSNRYVQVSQLKISPENVTKFFMIINRRCAPGDDACSGTRRIEIQIDSTNVGDFSGFNNWKIVDLYNDSTITVFDKRISNTINLGWYNPAEAKLYKIIPVMMSGGALTGNESISNVNITCDSTVYNNGYNITFGTGTTINFADNAEIIMDGGSFTCGTNIETSNPQVILTAKNNVWKGLNLNHSLNR